LIPALGNATACTIPAATNNAGVWYEFISKGTIGNALTITPTGGGNIVGGDLPNYNINNYNLPDSLIHGFHSLERRKKQHIAEMISGCIIKHEFDRTHSNNDIINSPSTRAYNFIRNEVNRLAWLENRKTEDDVLFRVLAKTFKFYYICSQMKSDHEIIQLISESCKEKLETILDTNKIYGHSIVDETFVRILNNTFVPYLTEQYVIAMV
jgi:hypothetical protein